MEKTSVRSSNIKSVGYIEKTCTLEVEFKNGSIYAYLNIPHSLYLKLLKAKSKGSFLDKKIKKAGYKYKKLN